MTNHPASRSGLATLCVLVCLSVVLSLALVIQRQTIRSQRELKLQRQLLQTEWLLQAGIHRAAVQLAQSTEYEGETWTPEVAGFNGLTPSVQIERSSDSDDDPPILKITARIGPSETQNAADLATQRSLQFKLNPSSR